jgi:CRP/FNR family transcriptional regulator, cyclic AMP receptor protein
VLTEAVAETKSLDHDKLAAYMHKAKFNTVAGNFSFAQDGEWSQTRQVWTQFQNVLNNFDQFRDGKVQPIVWPIESKSGDIRILPVCGWEVPARCRMAGRGAQMTRISETSRLRSLGLMLLITADDGAPSMPMPLIPEIAVFQRKLATLPVVTYQAGETVLSAASTTGRLLILKEGAVAVVKEGVEIARVAEPGAVFGELSVLLDQPHTADVHALETSQFHVADAATMLRIDPIALLYVATVLAQRLDSANRGLLELKRQVQAGEPGSVIGRTVEKIEGLLGATGANLMYAGYPYDPFADAPKS